MICVIMCLVMFMSVHFKVLHLVLNLGLGHRHPLCLVVVLCLMDVCVCVCAWIRSPCLLIGFMFILHRLHRMLVGLMTLEWSSCFILTSIHVCSLWSVLLIFLIVEVLGFLLFSSLVIGSL